MPQGALGSNVAVEGGARVPLSLDSQGAASFAARHGALNAAALAAVLFAGANQAGATISAALATTYTGLCLSNPAGSGVNLSLLRVSGSLIVAPAAEIAMGLITGWSAAGIVTHTTALAPRCTFEHSTAPKANLDAACTIVGAGTSVPAWARWFNSSPTATGIFGFDEDMAGGLIIPPGGYVAIGANVAGPAAGLLGSMLWEEIPTS